MALPRPHEAEVEAEGGASEESEPKKGDMAWEINFSSDQNKSARKPFLSKFLRSRDQPEVPAAERIKASPKNKPPGRSSSSPLKARGLNPKASAKPPSKSKSSPGNKQAPPSLSPRKSPTIKKPLLPVSPTKKSARTLELRSQSDCSLTSGSTVKGLSKPRPQSAKTSPGVAASKKSSPPVKRAASAGVKPALNKPQGGAKDSVKVSVLSTCTYSRFRLSRKSGGSDHRPQLNENTTCS